MFTQSFNGTRMLAENDSKETMIYKTVLFVKLDLCSQETSEGALNFQESYE